MNNPNIIKKITPRNLENNTQYIRKILFGLIFVIIIISAMYFNRKGKINEIDNNKIEQKMFNEMNEENKEKYLNLTINDKNKVFEEYVMSK